MAVDGNWNITMSTPMGERKATLTLLSSGGTLTGTQGADGNSTEIFDGAISGDAVNWKVSITNPMPLTLEFIGKVSGDSMSGEMGIGPMGASRSRGRGPEPDSGKQRASRSRHPCTRTSHFDRRSSPCRRRAANAQRGTPEPGVARKCARAGADGLCRGRSLRTDEAAHNRLSRCLSGECERSEISCQRVRAATRRWSSGLRQRAMAALRGVDRRTEAARVAMATTSDFAKTAAELAAKRAPLPTGTEPCDLGAWSERSRSQAASTSAPNLSVKARVLGTLPPPYRLEDGRQREHALMGGWLTEFRIIGFKDGWFLIEGATPPGQDYEDEKKYPAQRAKALCRTRLGRRQQGRRQLRQWRHADGRTVPGALYRCQVDASAAQARRPARHRRRPETHARLQRLLGPASKAKTACARWWRALCSNQVTNCS